MFFTSFSHLFVLYVLPYTPSMYMYSILSRVVHSSTCFPLYHASCLGESLPTTAGTRPGIPLPTRNIHCIVGAKQ